MYIPESVIHPSWPNNSRLLGDPLVILAIFIQDLHPKNLNLAHGLFLDILDKYKTVGEIYLQVSYPNLNTAQLTKYFHDSVQDFHLNSLDDTCS